MSINKDRFRALPIKERAALINTYVSGGVMDLAEMKRHYNSFAPGGPIETDEYSYPADITPAIVTQDSEFNKFLMTLPDNQRLTPEEDYHTYQYWKINGRPKDFSEALNLGMYHYDSSDNSYHANSVAFDSKGVGHFMKPKHHSTVKYELDWYNKGVGTLEGGEQYPLQGEERKEWEDFRSQYQLDSTGVDYKYVPRRHYNSFGPGGDLDNFDIEPAIITGTSNLTNAFFKDFSDRYYNYHNKNIEDKVQKVLSEDTKRNKSKTSAYYNPITDGITLSPNSDAAIYTHELTHKLNNSFPKRIRRTRSEKKLLKDAYPLGNRDNRGKLYGLFVGPTEYFTTNTELRRRISQYYGNVIGNELNDVINNMSDEQLAIFAGASGYNSFDDFYVMPSDITDGKSYYNKYRLQYEDSPEWEELSDKQKELYEYRFKTGLGKRNFKTYDENRLKLVRQALINIAANGGKLNIFDIGGDKDTWYKRLYSWVFNDDNTEETTPQENKYLTNDNYLDEVSKFISTFEEFYPNAYEDTHNGKNIWTVGSGLTYFLDDEGNEIKVKKGDTITKEENINQLNKRLQKNIDYVKSKTQYWDNYPAELKFQLLDAMYNIGAPKVWNPETNYIKAIRQYENEKGWENPEYDLKNIFQHADWNLNNKGWLGIRSRMRRHPQSINAEDFSKIYQNNYRDSLRTAYDIKFQNN